MFITVMYEYNNNVILDKEQVLCMMKIVFLCDCPQRRFCVALITD